MLKLEDTLVDVRYILAAIKGARLSKRSVHKMDSYISPGQAIDRDAGYRAGDLVIGTEDRRLCRHLVLTGGGEDKFLRAIPVSVFLTAPLRFVLDLDTYKVGTVKQSSSLMHHFHSRGELTAADFTPTTDPRLIALANEKYRAWLAVGAKATSECREWEEFQDAIGRGYLYTFQWQVSYAVLRNVFFQRRGHRQGEFRELCDWMKGLPHSWLITVEKEA